MKKSQSEPTKHPAQKHPILTQPSRKPLPTSSMGGARYAFAARAHMANKANPARPAWRETALANPLVVKELAKGRVLHCKTRPFTLSFAAFCNAKCGLSHCHQAWVVWQKVVQLCSKNGVYACKYNENRLFLHTVKKRNDNGRKDRRELEAAHRGGV